MNRPLARYPRKKIFIRAKIAFSYASIYTFALTSPPRTQTMFVPLGGKPESKPMNHAQGLLIPKAYRRTFLAHRVGI